ncbi:O-fucosyltransferase 16-like isoform X2 [Quercus robur]|uniref:O-fucosyltransferase 16-like isoform X2 n=1 Tax=Quercus robur TaxID=38942 RepID=UPI0021638CD8|nr:O-fucosyltransferase 16-like isoform X2 [Quercus robur]
METLTTATQSEEENQQLEEQQQIQNELHLHSQNHQTVQCSSSSSSSADTNTNTIPLSIHLSFTDTETNTEIVMKKKKRLSNSGSNGHHHHNGVVLASLMYHFRRKRRLRRHLFPLLSVISGCFLLLFAAFSLPLHSVNNAVELRSGSDSDPFPAFSVPASEGSLGRDLWRTSFSELYRGCSNASDKFAGANVKTIPNRYLLIDASGGLNQQRTGITDAVVAAYILNATLVVPQLDQKSFWKDTSEFAEIFDVDQFISFLSKDVKIVKEIPPNGGKVLSPFTMRVPRKCNPKCYQSRVLPVLIKKHAVRLSKFDYRLSNKLGTQLQRLRCRVNYHALTFTDSIVEMGKNLVGRMRMKGKHFIALHLRFEPDMLAFSGCDYGGGEKERIELGEIRKRWKTLHTRNPDKVRRHGRCPLTPEEVGLMLRALGFGSDVHLYVASGEVYGGEETLAPLKALFPNFHSKETIASKEELAPFSSFSSRMAALDFIVCDESDVFVTNNNGNMARMLAGRRRYFGHKPTIRPNAKKLYRLFMNRNNMTWVEFASKVRTFQIGFMGEPNEVKPGTGELHENPLSCICEKSGKKAKVVLIPQNETHNRNTSGKEDNTNKDTGDVTDKQSMEDELEWSDMDYMENVNRLQGKGFPNGTESDPNISLKPDLPELAEELFSD